MQIEGTLPNQNFPFKFNSSWLDSDDLCTYIKDVWLNFTYDESLNPMDSLVAKLILLKEAVTKWINFKKYKDWEEFTNLED